MIPIIKADAIRPLLDIEALIPSAESAFRAISKKTAQVPLFVLHPNSWSDIHVKAAALPDCPIFTVKMAGWSQKLVDRDEPASSGMIAVFDSETCQPVAIVQDDHLISDYRTAAAGAVAARLLAPEEVSNALVIGTGAQALLQAKALLLVRPIKTIEVWGRDGEKAAHLVERLEKDHQGIRIRVAEDLPRSASVADVIVVATGAKSPVLQAEWLRPGQHITSVGSDDATKCELDPQIFASAQVFVDSKDSAQAFGSTRRAIEAGVLSLDHLMEIGDALDLGRFNLEAKMSVACLSGLGVQDLTALNHIWSSLCKP